MCRCGRLEYCAISKNDYPLQKRSLALLLWLEFYPLRGLICWLIVRVQCINLLACIMHVQIEDGTFTPIEDQHHSIMCSHA